jgi:CTP:molybdopterin cytidylyltransferase MocA
MTVAAIILVATTSAARSHPGGAPLARRLADVAWSGGATPVVICSADPDGAVAAALSGAEATLLAEPAEVAVGPVGRLVLGIEEAARLVAGTDAAIAWPAHMSWVDAGTVTTLIAAHGEHRGAVIRPAFHGAPGHPLLVPVACTDALRALGAGAVLDDLPDGLAAAGMPVVVVETGNPGVTHDMSVPEGEMPSYEGPPEPPDAHAHEWGDEIAP